LRPIVLEARDLWKRYTAGGRTAEAVAGVSLAVAAGEFVAVVGRSGSGKSTLLAMLGGLCRPSAGSVCVGGADVWSLPAGALAEFRGRRVGFVSQSAGLLPTLRAVDNVALPALLAGQSSPDAAYREAARLLARVGLGGRREAFPHELSGGEQRRAALARALVNRPPLLLADEPTADLDGQTESEIFGLLRGLQRAWGAALVLVTHNPDLAAHADRVVRIDGGRVIADGPPARAVVPSPPTLPPDEPPTPDEPIARPATGFVRTLAGGVAWAAVVVLAALAADHVIARKQRSAIEGAEAARREVREAALFAMRADIDDITYGPGRDYRLTLFVQNLDPERELSVMAPEVRAYVQVGAEWREVPLRPADDQEGRTVKLTGGRHTFAYRFTADIAGFEELLPGYMHVRFKSAALVGRGPDAAPWERADDFYIYLKPHGADDAAILRKTPYPGRPPVWIPMPAH
jgi:ABC-type lipoprotein export system ATPase subunit